MGEMDAKELIHEMNHIDKQGSIRDILQQSTKSFFGTNPATDDKDEDRAKSYSSVIDKILSEKDIDQKSILHFEQIIGILELGAYNRYNEVTYGTRDDIADFIIIDTIIKMLNEDGKGRYSIIALFQGIKESIDEQLRYNLQSPFQKKIA
jgi:hypothetical protein